MHPYTFPITMTILNKFFGKSGQQSTEEQIKHLGFEISTCPETCDDCTSKFPKSLSFEESDKLWQSTKPYGLHLNVSTGRTDWPHDATGTSGTLSHAVASWASKHGDTPIGTIKVTCSSFASDEMFTDEDYITEQTGDVLVLPYFLWIKGLKVSEVDKVLTKLVSILSSTDHDKLQVSDIQAQIPQIIPDVNKAYILLCSHRTRDKRCGITAPIMKREMEMYLRELDLYRDMCDTSPGGVNVGFINHIGGHKYAANVIIYLKLSGRNIWLALCKPNNVRPIIDECILHGGKVWPDKVRLVQKFNPIEW